MMEGNPNNSEIHKNYNSINNYGTGTTMLNTNAPPQIYPPKEVPDMEIGSKNRKPFTKDEFR